jgi:hypothetical protein
VAVRAPSSMMSTASIRIAAIERSTSAVPRRPTKPASTGSQNSSVHRPPGVGVTVQVVIGSAIRPTWSATVAPGRAGSGSRDAH